MRRAPSCTTSFHVGNLPSILRDGRLFSDIAWARRAAGGDRIVVKVVDQLGDEVMKVFRV